MHPLLVGTHKVFFWNLDGAVGEHGANKIDDVQLIQFYYQLYPRLTRGAPEPAVLAQVKAAAGTMDGRCSGRPDDPLCQAIRAHQQRNRLPIVDGRVSVSQKDATFGPREQNFFMIIMMMTAISATFDIYPRLDKIPGCPPLVRQKVLDVFNLAG
jgi:hypothetical protein